MLLQNIEEASDIFSKVKHLRNIKKSAEESTKVKVKLNFSKVFNSTTFNYDIELSKEEILNIVEIKIGNYLVELARLGITF